MKEGDEKALHKIGEEIRRYRDEWLDSIREQIETDVVKMESDGFDPARGRGRGPKWADGA